VETFGHMAALLGCVLIPGWVFLRDPGEEIHQLFALLGLAGLVYNGFSFAAALQPPGPARLELVRYAYLGSFLLLPVVVRFPRTFLGDARVPGSRRLEALSWILALAFAATALTGGFLERIDDAGQAVGGVALLLWTLVVGAGFLYFTWVLRGAHARAPDAAARNRVLYLVLGAGLFALPAGLDLLYRLGLHLGLPFPLAPLGSLGFLACLGVAVVKHRLLDIEVVLHRGLVLTLVTPLTAVSFVVLGELLEDVLSGHLPPDSPYPDVLAALVVAALFGPLSAFLSHLVDVLVVREFSVAPRLQEFRRLSYLIGAQDVAGLQALRAELDAIIQRLEARQRAGGEVPKTPPGPPREAPVPRQRKAPRKRRRRKKRRR